MFFRTTPICHHAVAGVFADRCYLLVRPSTDHSLSAQFDLNEHNFSCQKQVSGAISARENSSARTQHPSRVNRIPTEQCAITCSVVEVTFIFGNKHNESLMKRNFIFYFAYPHIFQSSSLIFQIITLSRCYFVLVFRPNSIFNSTRGVGMRTSSYMR